MKNLTYSFFLFIAIVYLLIGLGIETFHYFVDGYNDTFLEGLIRENDKLSPYVIFRIIFWPFYI